MKKIFSCLSLIIAVFFITVFYANVMGATYSLQGRNVSSDPKKNTKGYWELEYKARTKKGKVVGHYYGYTKKSYPSGITNGSITGGNHTFAGNTIDCEDHWGEPKYKDGLRFATISGGTVHSYNNGVSDPETIDKAWTLGTGAPHGPFKILDTVGLETAKNIVLQYQKVPNLLDPLFKKMMLPYNYDGMLDILNDYIAKGKTGKAAGEGFYKHEKKK